MESGFKSARPVGHIVPEVSTATSTEMKGGHRPIMAVGEHSAKEGQQEDLLPDLTWIAPGATALIVCMAALVAALQTIGNGPWYYLATLVSGLAFGAALLTRAAISAACKSVREQEDDPDRAEAEWLRPLFEALARIWLVRGPGGDLEATIARAVESLATGIGLGEIAAFLVDQPEEGLRLVAHYSCSPPSSEIKVPELAMSMAQRALHSRRPVESDAFPYLRQHPIKTHTQATAISVLALPFGSNGRIYGVLVVASEPGFSLSGGQRDVARAFAEILAMTLDATLLYDEVRRSRDQMTTLFKITMDITSQLQLEEVLRSIVRRTVILLDGFCGGVRLIERTESGWRYGPITFWPIDEDNGDLLLALERGTENVIDDGMSRVIEVPLQTAEAPSGNGSRSYGGGIIVPMKWEGDVIGVLYVLMDQQDRASTDTDASLLNLLASQAAIAVQNSRLYESCQALAVTDSLTGLYNRRFFSEELAREISNSSREEKPLSLIVLDVDRLKNHNDSRGHLEGDKMLCEIAEIMRLVVRESDIASRYGGDEFAVLLPGTTETEALQIAERIRSEVESRQLTDANISVSLGLATFPTDACDAENLMVMADRRLYAAKALGRNRVCGSNVDSSRQESVVSPI